MSIDELMGIGGPVDRERNLKSDDFLVLYYLKFGTLSSHIGTFLLYFTC